MKKCLNQMVIGTAAAVCLTSTMAQAADADYPDGPIRMIVPYSPGSGIDILARVAGQRMGPLLGQSFVVDNRAGASGMIGTRAAKQAKPDGYTVMMSVIGHVLNASVFPVSAQYDPVNDFTPISQAVLGRLVLVVQPRTGIRSIKDFLDKARSAPDALTYATPGTGTPQHLAMELFARTAKFELLHVPYSGTAGAMTGMLGNEADAMFMPVHLALPHLQSGRFIALGLASEKRSSIAPDIPTLAEQGYPGAEADMWYGLFGPANLPEPIVAKLNQALNDALADAETRNVLEKQGLEVGPSTPAEFKVLVEKENAKWKQAITAAGLVAE
ncbi:MAG: tripartite tricarboxylate transporter substrate binding protein [Pigmentiphaga sp.]